MPTEQPRQIFDTDGNWLCSGDKVRLTKAGHVTQTRLVYTKKGSDSLWVYLGTDTTQTSIPQLLSRGWKVILLEEFPHAPTKEPEPEKENPSVSGPEPVRYVEGAPDRPDDRTDKVWSLERLNEPPSEGRTLSEAEGAAFIEEQSRLRDLLYFSFVLHGCSLFLLIMIASN